ncbi:hypothetical protein GCM10027175_24100 [Hymenobacter latericoloratus]
MPEDKGLSSPLHTSRQAADAPNNYVIGIVIYIGGCTKAIERTGLWGLISPLQSPRILRKLVAVDYARGRVNRANTVTDQQDMTIHGYCLAISATGTIRAKKGLAQLPARGRSLIDAHPNI